MRMSKSSHFVLSQLRPTWEHYKFHPMLLLVWGALLDPWHTRQHALTRGMRFSQLLTDVWVVCSSFRSILCRRRLLRSFLLPVRTKFWNPKTKQGYKRLHWYPKVLIIMYKKNMCPTWFKWWSPWWELLWSLSTESVTFIIRIRFTVALTAHVFQYGV